jgi:carbon-monoxide dehydrogenase medium subunit
MLNTSSRRTFPVKLPAFAYHRADSLSAAVAVLAEHGGEARVLGGGQSLLPVMALRMSNPEVLVDVTAAPDLHGHEVEDSVVVPAAVTMRTLETDPAVARAHPLLVACLGHIGHVEIRTRGTVCGSLAHADPAAELPALLLAAEGSIRLVSARGSRQLTASEFVLGPYTTPVAEDEMVAAAELPCLAPTAGCSVREIARRSGDFALAGVVAVVDTAPDDRCTSARVALFGVAAAALRAGTAEQVLLGSTLDDEVLDEAARRAFDDIEVIGDLHGSAEYRRRAGIRLVAGALREAAARATAKHQEQESARA